MLAKYLSMSRCERFGGIEIANRDFHWGAGWCFPTENGMLCGQ